MKKIIVIFFLVSFFAALTACPKSTVTPPPPINKDWTITAIWNYDFTNFTPCSANVPIGCITGFTWGYLSGATQVPLHNTDTAVCTGQTQPQLCSDTVQSKLPIGAVTFYAAANFLDNKGVGGTSNTITTAQPTTIAVGNVSGLQVSAK